MKTCWASPRCWLHSLPRFAWYFLERHPSTPRETYAASSAQRSPMTLISSVHTLLIQTLSLPSTPSTSSSSTPSHQHLRAGLRQNSSSFCAMPTALLPISLPRMSDRSRASARLQMTALLGSPARCPQESSWLKPLISPSISISYTLIIVPVTYPAVSISIRCASVVPGSSLRLSPEKMPFWRSSARAAARLTSIMSGWLMSARGGMA
jgi:hypothetical protein